MIDNLRTLKAITCIVIVMARIIVIVTIDFFFNFTFLEL